MPISQTYEPIATQSSNGSASTITFSSIPSTFTDLVLVIRGSGSGGSVDTTLRFNSDSGTNYSRHYMYGDGNSVQRAVNVNMSQIGSGVNVVHHFMNYSNTNVFKTIIGNYWESSNLALTQAILWRSTSAIDTIAISIVGSGQTFTSGSTFTLYGIKAA
jgi:hypothetical protein